MIELYTNILSSYSLQVTEDGEVLNSEGGVFSINGKPVAIPTSYILKNIMEDVDGKLQTKYTIFNPLHENMVGSRNIVMEAFLKLSNMNIASFAAMTMVNLISKLAEDPKDPSMIDIAVKVETVKGKAKELFSKATVDKLDKLILHGVKENKLVKWYMKKNLKYDGETYLRAIVSKYPYTDITRQQVEEIVGKVSAKDYDLFKILYDDIVETIFDKDEVIKTSNDKLAPYASALFRSYYVSMKAIEKYANKYGLDADFMSIDYDLDSFIDMKDKYSKQLSTIVKIDDNGEVENKTVSFNNTVTNIDTAPTNKDFSYNEEYARPDVNGNLDIGKRGNIKQDEGPSELDILDMVSGVRGNGYGSGGNAYGVQPTGNMYGTQPMANTYGVQPTGNMYGTQPMANTYGVQPTGNMYGTQPMANTYGTQPMVNNVEPIVGQMYDGMIFQGYDVQGYPVLVHPQELQLQHQVHNPTNGRVFM